MGGVQVTPVTIGQLVDAEERARALTFGERMALDDFVWLYNRQFTIDQRRHLLALRALHEVGVLTEWPDDRKPARGITLAAVLGLGCWCLIGLAVGWAVLR